MELKNKLEQIVRIQEEFSAEKPGPLNPPISQTQIQQLESLLEEPLPADLIQLYSFANGQSDDGHGIFFGERFISAGEIASQLDFSRSLIRPEKNEIRYPEQSTKLLKQIVDFYLAKAPGHHLPVGEKGWYKIVFKCGIGAYEGPYVYATENTTPKEKTILRIDHEAYKTLAPTILALKDLEKPDYHWDELGFTVYSDGRYTVERTSFDFDTQISFTSTPEHAIRKKYFHYKWIPVFSDYSGNFIGIDLDPDKNGKKGQVINFGRDEEHMMVFADSLEQFFEFILQELQKPGNQLLNPEFHLHDTLKNYKK